MKTEYLLMLSEILDKMEITEELKSLEVNTGDEKKDQEELGKQLIALLVTRIYKCKTEVYKFIATYKGYYPEELEFNSEDTEEIKKEKTNKYELACKEAIKKAKNEDVIAILKEVSKLSGLSDFLSIA